MATPKILLYEVELRAVRLKRNLSRPVVYTNDLNSAEFQFKVIDMDAGDLSTATATTLLYMRDGSFFQNRKEDVSLVGTTFSYTLKENEGNHAGVAQIQLVVTVDGMELASQLYDFEIINGLETKVAQEVMIYDWTTLTRDARAYIDQFVADEVYRDAQFDNAQFDRNTAFVASQDARTLAFGTEQTNRGTAFTAEQNERTAEFNESESGRTTAETGRVTAESNRVTAETERVTKEGQRITAETNRVTAEGNRVTAESGRVTAESGRVTAETNRAAAFTAFDTRLTAEETATANNKISAVKGKTFADVDARIEDVEFDTTLMATNLVTNGDFSSGMTGWSTNGVTATVVNNEASLTITGLGSKGIYRTIESNLNDMVYFAFEIYPKYSAIARVGFLDNAINFTKIAPNAWNRCSAVLPKTTDASTIIYYHKVDDGNYVIGDTFKLRRNFAINLTTTFGKGNEPTAEQMDGILAKFTNSWFDGTKNLFRANATLNKLIAVDARTEFEAKNELVNGDFSNGNTGWALESNFGISNGKLIFTTVEGGNTGRNATPANAKIISGNIYYLTFNQTILPGTYGYIRRALNGLEALKNDATNGRIVLRTTAAVNADFYLRVSEGGDSCEFDNFILINLTATFGAGKEPTLAEMDRLMARFPNSWFDGVKPLQTIETLYQEKANKVQEAWITPTLLNGAVPVASKPPQYYKDEFGAVVVQGLVTVTSLNSDIFTLPIGYRPTKSKVLPTTANNNSFASVLVKTTGEVQLLSGTLASVSVDCIRFKAEQ